MVTIAMAVSMFRIKRVFGSVETEFLDLCQSEKSKYCGQIEVLGDTSMNRLVLKLP